VAVFTCDQNVDPVGACVGYRGIRVQTIANELRGEKIDIVRWSDKTEEWIANALSPSKVISVTVCDNEKMARVIVPDHQLSLAIGKEGQNVRLAAKLTNWKIDIKSESAEYQKNEN
jgi:transcription termination/antitermination protein NusA